MDKEYSFKLKEIVNNLNKENKASNSIESLKHNMNNNGYDDECKKVYDDNAMLFIGLAEENIITIADLNLYIDWIKQYGKH